MVCKSRGINGSESDTRIPQQLLMGKSGEDKPGRPLRARSLLQVPSSESSLARGSKPHPLTHKSVKDVQRFLILLHSTWCQKNCQSHDLEFVVLNIYSHLQLRPEIGQIKMCFFFNTLTSNNALRDPLHNSHNPHNWLILPSNPARPHPHLHSNI